MPARTKDDYFESGRPVHRTSYCAFLDVLGFTARIEKSFEENRGDSLLQEFHGVLAQQINTIQEDTDDSLLYFKSFTDNIILAHPRFSLDLESEFGFILWSMSQYQLNMALHGFFIRGGLSIGDLFVDENSVYGPALLEAYNLESKTAVNPIIVLSDDVMALVRHHLTFYAGDFAPQHRSVLVSPDGRFFINYLDECIVDAGDSEDVDWSSLSTHKTNIETALAEHRSAPAIFNKYSWLAAYHNYFCQSLVNHPDFEESILISNDVAPIAFRTLAEVTQK